MVSLQNLQKRLQWKYQDTFVSSMSIWWNKTLSNNTNIKELNSNDKYDTNEEKYLIISKQNRIEISTKISNFTRIDYQHRL